MSTIGTEVPTINFTWHLVTNTTNAPWSHQPYPVFVGYIAAIIAVVLYGSNFVPIKKFYTGNGMFFQWILCSGIFMVGVVIQLIQQSEFYPLVMLGGVLWTTGNLCVVPIFKTIGMGLGLSTWSTFGLVMGWATGRFGLFKTDRDKISNPAMNYAGVVVACCSILFYIMVKAEVTAESTDIEINVNVNDPESSLSSSARSYSTSYNGSAANRSNVIIFKKPADKSLQTKPDTESDDRMFVENLPPIQKKIIGTTLGIFSGILYGVQFTPCIYVQDNYHNVSKNGLDYVFAQFCGIYATSCVYFFIYCAISRNKPKVYPQVVLPGIVSGIMWAIATTSWFIANAEISESVSYPIIMTGPAAIASLFWSVVVFREIKGLRNIILLLVAFCVMAGGAILAGLSR